MDRERFLVACRNLNDYRLAGHQVPADFQTLPCEICHREIVVSPRGIEQSKRGGFLVCNGCAFDMARGLQDAGKDTLFIANPSAIEQLQRSLRKAR